VLLALLNLGVKNITLGPTLPAFVSPNVLNVLVENFNIRPNTTVEEDMKVLLPMAPAEKTETPKEKPAEKPKNPQNSRNEPRGNQKPQNTEKKQDRQKSQNTENKLEKPVEKPQAKARKSWLSSIAFIRKFVR